jgi:hypothetical protein
MKLSTLIAYRNHLDSLTPKDTKSLVLDAIGPSLHMVENNLLKFDKLTEILKQDSDNIQTAYDAYNLTINKIQQQVQLLIDNVEPSYMVESYRLYEKEMIDDSDEYILDRKLHLTTEAQEYLQDRIKLHGDWKHPGMIIRPGTESWIELLVGCDPLYLVDENQNLLVPAMFKFNPAYRNRLRPYAVKERDTTNQILKSIPDSQFAYCLVYNFFNYKPFEILKSYFSEIYSKLKPGGTLAFTFNDCDRAGGVVLVERHFMCYTPGSLLLALCKSLGYEVIQTYPIDTACTWVELRKPGTLTSLRGGQSLAKIIANS